MEKIKAKVEQVLHKDHGSSSGTAAHTTGTHTGTHSDPTGPHDSHTANKLDPQVDSTHVGGHGNTASAGGLGHTTHTGTHTGVPTGGLTGNTHGSDPTGPHDSHLANRADPRVGSDHVGAGGLGGTHTGGLTGNTHSSGLTGNTHAGGLTGDTHTGGRTGNTHSGGLSGNTHTGGLTGDTHTGGLTGNTHTGGLSDNTHTGGLPGSTHAGHSGLAGNTYGSNPTGPHDSHLANKADPRVDSDHVGGYGNTAGTGGYGSTHSTGAPGSHGLTGQGSHFPGPAPNTAGPHKSDMLNKADPRVDADLDGSKTYGGNKTYGN